MPQGSYNVSRLLAELGLKNVIDMPVSQSIQPTIPLASMLGQVPYHSAPMALFGGDVVGAAAPQHSAIELVSLDPGGGLLLYFYQSPGAAPPRLRIEITDPAFPMAWTVGPVNHPAQNFGDEDVLTTVASGTTLNAAPAVAPTILELLPASAPALWVPRGKRVRVINAVSGGFGIGFALAWMGIAATQSGDE